MGDPTLSEASRLRWRPRQLVGRLVGGGARRLREVGWRRLAAYAGCWFVFALPAALFLFTHTSTTTDLASHDAVIRPTFDGEATAHLGPFLPDIRGKTGGRIGIDITLGKTEATSTEALVRRYAFIASEPEAQIDKVRHVVTEVALLSVVRGALIGAIPIGIWLLVGAERRAQLRDRVRTRLGARGSIPLVLVLVAGLVVAVEPWNGSEETLDQQRRWVSLARFVPEVPMPAEVGRLQVRVDLTSDSTRTLALSAVDTYARSKRFFDAATRDARDLVLRRPAEGETVAVLVSDRHDNIGMDPVVRAAAKRAGATAVVDAGDDTSTGSRWEAFSLDSLNKTTQGLDQRFNIAGNHDHGTFVANYLRKLGWTHLQGKVVEGPGGSRISGVDDPRSSGLGTWRTEKGLSFAEQTDLIERDACRADADGDRINTLVVHDANSGRKALAAGCVDLVVSGHVHVQEGPTQVLGANGKVGWAYTNGTTGGAAYAIALGSKLRREAEFSFITYAGGRPVGIQPVQLRTDGKFVVEDYVPLDYRR